MESLVLQLRRKEWAKLQRFLTKLCGAKQPSLTLKSLLSYVLAFKGSYGKHSVMWTSWTLRRTKCTQRSWLPISERHFSFKMKLPRWLSTTTASFQFFWLFGSDHTVTKTLNETYIDEPSLCISFLKDGVRFISAAVTFVKFYHKAGPFHANNFSGTGERFLIGVNLVTRSTLRINSWHICCFLKPGPSKQINLAVGRVLSHHTMHLFDYKVGSSSKMWFKNVELYKRCLL